MQTLALASALPPSLVDDIVEKGNHKAAWQHLCSSSSKKGESYSGVCACYIPTVGCIVQTTTIMNGMVAEALVFVPGVYIHPDTEGAGATLRKL